MAANIINVRIYEPKTSDVFFFDNNIWMFIFCPLGNYNRKRQKYYSSFLQSIKSTDGCIFISSLILSEFSNRYLRMDFEQWKKEINDLSKEFKKDYIGSDRYTETVDEIKIQTNQILKICERTSDNFNAINLTNVYTHLTQIDFNDSYYIELATMNNWKIVTDDQDFVKYQKHNLGIITYLD